MPEIFTVEDIDAVNAYWGALNSLSADRSYPYENPLLRETLRLEDIKARLLERRGITCITGPGHGGSDLLANISQDAAEVKQFFKQFSFPQAIPNHVAPKIFGSLHKGEGRARLSLSHAFGAAFDSPDMTSARHTRKLSIS